VPAIDHVVMAGTFTFPDDVPTLSDGEVTLRAHRLSDVDQVVEQCVDPESVRWTTVPERYTRDMAVEFVTKYAEESWAKRSDLMFAIEAEHPDGTRKFSGTCSLRPMSEGAAEIAFGVHPAVRGRGVCTRAVKLLLDWGFAQGDVEVVVWYAYVGNWGSRRVAWANGFTFTGTVDKLLPQRGVRLDSWFGSLRKDDSRDPKHPWHVPPVLESDRLRLRPLRESDADRMDEMLTDERTQAFIGRYLAGDQVGAATKILRQLDRNARGEGYNWCIAARETDRLIGHIHLWDLGGFDPTSARLGYSVHPESRGRGVLTGALDLVVEWSFRPVADGGPGFRRLSLGTAASNAASRHAAEKAGFVHVASEPAAFPTGEFGFEDSVTYHQLNQRWMG
jgi:RimJ/RimL family protein N-acetyltransferase